MIVTDSDGQPLIEAPNSKKKKGKYTTKDIKEISIIGRRSKTNKTKPNFDCLYPSDFKEDPKDRLKRLLFINDTDDA